ncbi:hypothetical protein NADFUDRAFT_53282 [Nadsonia fulvescens var. elongata DSM 6958]|uniref:SET domain-containing protein n=1 Tax=Nadsonia fulvescens var. elongata DSM 6958 TaxID=857566 RepID=A0A1E3PDV0_9ASCO|nr:hypothetical protein NADFUDRAFT_53282 [Nadsonia fulvescens var. elongata DSM 6958]
MAPVVPTNWPSSVIYTQTNIYSKSFSPDQLQSLGRANLQKPLKPQPPAKLVKIKPITDPSHPACGQFGLFATQKLPPKSHIIDYLGYVHLVSESDVTSDYDITLDGDLGVAIDAAKWGCEARMINDYRGVKERPNVIFENRIVGGELRMAVWVGGKEIKKGEEVCVSYGKGFWKARYD